MNLRDVLFIGLVLIMAGAWTAAGDSGAELTVPPSDVIFSHQFHVEDQEIDCETCHIDIATSGSAQDRNLPTMDECSSCHDVEDDENCGMCHRDIEDPSAPPEVDRPIEFPHETHLSRQTPCETCHSGIATATESVPELMPLMAVCMNCHDGEQATKECRACHGDRLTLVDLHPGDWPNQHGDMAANRSRYCANCHKSEIFCLDCHSGDNLTGSIHNLNYRYTHGLDANSKEIDCQACHEIKPFCNDCHLRENRMPLNHSTLSWRQRHGDAARDDIENCASCHDAADPTCARSGCHREGSGHRIHDPDLGRFDREGPWHDDESYFCFQCHITTRQAGVGFCGYCHG